MKRFMLKNLLTTMVCLAMMPALASAGSLDEALNTLTAEIEKYLKDKNESQVGIGAFSVPASSGRLIDRELRKKLEDKQIKVLDEADLPKWTVRGSIEIAPGASQTVTALIAQIFNENNEEIKGFRQRFNDVTQEQRDKLEEQASKSAAKGSEITPVPSATKSGTTPDAASAPVVPKTPKEGAIIDDPVDVARLLGSTVDNEKAVKDRLKLADVTGPTPSRQLTLADKQLAIAARDQAVARSRSNEAAFDNRSNSVIAASDTSLFEVEILATSPGFSGVPTRGDYAPVPIANKRGLPFAEMQKDQIYCVKVYNRSNRPVGVELSIDGINTLELCKNPAFRQVGKYFVDAQSTATFIGWLVDDNTWESFKLTAEPEGVAVELGRVQKIGVISVGFFPTWSEGEPEPVFQKLFAGGSRSIATGRGPVQEANGVKGVRSNFGSEPLSIVTIRYRNPDPPADLPEAEKTAGN